MKHSHDVEDLGLAMQQAAEAHVNKVWAAFHLREEAEEDGPSPEMIDSLDPAVGPFCGCDTCVIRETLAGAWPVIEEYIGATKTQTCRCRSVPAPANSGALRSLPVASLDPADPGDWR